MQSFIFSFFLSFIHTIIGADGINATDVSGNSALHKAARSGATGAIRALISAGASLDGRNSLRQTPLYIACSQGQVETARVLIDAGADVIAHTISGSSPLQAAVHVENLEIVKTLLKNFGLIQSSGLVAGGSGFAEANRALVIASGMGHENIVSHLVSYCCDVNSPSEDNFTALMAAATYGHETVVKLLLASNADPNKSGRFGETPLILAARKGFRGVCKRLLVAGADANYANDNGVTSLLASCSEGHVDVMSLLVQAGADVNGGGCCSVPPPIVVAAAKNNLEAVAVIADSGADLEAVDSEGNSPLCSAVLGAVGHRNDGVVDYLLQRGADVNCCNSQLDTPLILGSRVGVPRFAIDRLLQNGAQIDHQNVFGETALMIASENKHYAMVELLLNAGADSSMKTQLGETALDKAVSSWVVGRVMQESKSNSVFCSSTSTVKALLQRKCPPGIALHVSLFQKQLPPIMADVLKTSSPVPSLVDLSVLYPRRSPRCVYTRATPFSTALAHGHAPAAHFFLLNWFLHRHDVTTLARNAKVRRSICTSRNAKCSRLYQEVFSQPWTLACLSFLVVSSALGCEDRRQRVERLMLPHILERKLLFEDESMSLPMDEWGNIKSLVHIHGAISKTTLK
ncbi:ankyrin repeat domain-containing protein 17 [Aplysia californica]|uniref:Ankyrin repeat domain-containing protein 17 n=1 Tax=Aplysia californica TaxID=6500 RepID=A0ABM0JUE8_APLCA|nr:ankyrin repeat domain-containing protein 17 [Aplysia californica]